MSFTRRQLRASQKEKTTSKLLIFLLIIVFISIYIFFSIRSIGDMKVASGTYNLDKGTTTTMLPKAFGLNISDWQYKIWLRIFAPSFPSIQAGTYKIERTLSFSSVITETLKSPKYTDITITILPGWNMYDIDEYLSKKKIIQTGELLIAARDNFSRFQSKYSFLKGQLSLEGFLYPDTYRILPTSDSYMIIDRLLTEFDTKIGKTYSGLGSLAYQNLILASIVEREERDPVQKPIVADILDKRVREYIPMGADATVCYGYAKTQKQCTPEFIGSVIAKKDIYNTRNKQGYPPTPISSISLETWNAVLQKTSSAYYYYLHDSQGNIHYAKTLQEHNINKQKYIQ